MGTLMVVQCGRIPELGSAGSELEPQPPGKHSVCAVLTSDLAATSDLVTAER